MATATVTNSRQRAKLARLPNNYEKRLRINNVINLSLVTIFLLTLNFAKLVECSEADDPKPYLDSNKVDDGPEDSRTGLFSDVYRNGTFRTGNTLWDNILNQCTVKPTVTCLQKNIYSYLDEKLNVNGEIRVTDSVCFKKNNVDVEKFSKEANVIYLTGSTNEERDDFEARAIDEENSIEEESETPLEEVTDALYSKSINFLASHDMKLTLPELFFHGATLKVSPRALTKTGALVHIELEPKVESNGQGRIFFHKIKKYIRKKLVMAAIAIILVVKLIALKLIFVLPIIFGITTAKKMFLKLLLFLFPALSHIFKLCSWYHQNYHTTKFHHHHHLITHHHHKPPHHSISHGPVYGPPAAHPHGSSVSVQHPHHESSPGFEHYPQDWELSGPGLGNEYIATDIHRNAIANFKPNVNDANDINAWGLGLPPGTSMNVGEVGASSNNQPNVLAPNNLQPNLQPHSQPNLQPHSQTNLQRPSGPGRPLGPQQINPYHRNKKIQHKDPEKEALIRAAALAARAPPSAVRDEVLRVSAAKLHESNRIQTETELVRQQQEILAAQDPDTISAEKFYGPLLEKVDKILNPMGAHEPGCRERAVCVLYRDPFAHTPYSNLVSNELSKDSSELLPPAESKKALRYYSYVQAAREGQEQNNCYALYPNCNMDFNKK